MRLVRVRCSSASTTNSEGIRRATMHRCCAKGPARWSTLPSFPKSGENSRHSTALGGTTGSPGPMSYANRREATSARCATTILTAGLALLWSADLLLPAGPAGVSRVLPGKCDKVSAPPVIATTGEDGSATPELLPAGGLRRQFPTHLYRGARPIAPNLTLDGVRPIDRSGDDSKRAKREHVLCAETELREPWPTAN